MLWDKFNNSRKQNNIFLSNKINIYTDIIFKVYYIFFYLLHVLYNLQSIFVVMKHLYNI